MTEIVLTTEQISAVDELKAWAKSPLISMKSLSGSAGVGKTVLTKELKRHLPVNVAWSAMTGKAALRLSECAGVSAKTLHATIYGRPTASGKNLYFNTMKKPACDLLVIDESSMITPKIFEDLKNWEAQGVKVLFIGDHIQLPPILSHKEEQEHGTDFMVFREVHGPVLSKVMRSNDGVLEVVSLIRESKRFPTKGNDCVTVQEVQYPGLSAIKDYLDDPNDHFLITWTNKMRMQGNAEIRRRLGHKTKLPGPTEPILLRKNSKDRLNGEIVFAERFEEGPTLAGLKTWNMIMTDGTDLLVSASGNVEFMDGSLPNIKDWKEFHRQRNNAGLEEPIPITYGYVLTAHTAQGSQARRVSVYLSGSDMRNEHFIKDTKLPNGEIMPFSIRFLYTSTSRAQKQLSFYYSR